MPYIARTEFCCSLNVEKEYTSFRWDLPDFSLLKEYYKNAVSSEFMITNTEVKCHLEFALGKDELRLEVANTPITSTSAAARNASSRNSASGTHTSCNVPQFPRVESLDPPNTVFGYSMAPPTFVFDQVSKNSAPTIQSPGTDDYVYIYVHFPVDKQFDKMMVIVSIVDGSDTMKKLVTQTRSFTGGRMTFKLIEVSKLLNTLNASSYMHNDTLTILCEIINVKKQESVLIDKKMLVNHFGNEVQKNLQIFFKSQEFCDVTFTVGNTEFHGHKVILAANSPVFEAMFKTEMTERIEKTVKIQDVDVVTFEAFLTYIYTGSIAKMEEIVEDLLVVADKYQVLSLRNLCETHIADHLDKENAVKYLLVAYLHNFEELKTKALTFVRSYQQQIVDTVEFKKLCTYPDLVSEIFRKST